VSILSGNNIFSNESISPREDSIVPATALLLKSRVNKDFKEVIISARVDCIKQLARCKFSVFSKPEREEEIQDREKKRSVR